MTNPIATSIQYDPTSVNIWRYYNALKEQRKVIRSGFGLLGIYPYNSNRPTHTGQPAHTTQTNQSARPESVLEHVAGTMILTTAISNFRPDIIPPSDLLPCLLTLMHHEAGETIIGDIPDDGNRNEKAKDQQELTVIHNLFATLPSDQANTLETLFIQFQNRSTPVTQVAYAIDKLETIFQGLIYERDGHPGDFQRKLAAHVISSQDQYYIEITGTTSLVDNWSAHFFDKIKSFACAPFFTGLLRVAVEDVRGEWFTWLPK